MIPPTLTSVADTETNRPVHSAYVWLVAAAGALGGLLFGYDWVVIGGAKPFYEQYFQLQSPSLEGWAMSCALIGCLIGAVIFRGLEQSLRPKTPADAGRSYLCDVVGGDWTRRTFLSIRDVENVWRICDWACLRYLANVHRRDISGTFAWPDGFPQSARHCFWNPFGAGRELAHRPASTARGDSTRNPAIVEWSMGLALDVCRYRCSRIAISDSNLF